MIIVFGSNVLDLFFHLKDLPPRDTALFIDGHEEQPGGKGANQAIAAARAGSEVRFFGALGDGGHGRQMYKNLAKNGIDVSGIQFLDIPSGLATIFVDDSDGTHKVVVSQGANLKARQDTIPAKLLTKETTVLVQGELPMAETEALLARAKKAGARTVMNLAPASPLSEAALHNLDIIILNEYEADTLGGRLGMDTADKAAFAAALHARFRIVTIITLGPDGSLCCSDQGLVAISPLQVKAVDTIGAGDAFSGYLCAALDQGQDLTGALKSAAAAGSLACTRIGAQSALPTKEEVAGYAGQITVSAMEKTTVAASA